MRELSHAATPRMPSARASRYDDSTELVDTRTGLRHSLRFPRSDIDASVRFSYSRCIVSIIGFALVLTDIPRTGLSLSLSSYYKLAAPDVYWSYGPYAYPSIHINRTSSNGDDFTYKGSRQGLSVAAANVWAYKFDTLSIAQRAVAQHLEVASYPDCILYRSPCPTTTLTLATTFSMIDDWITAAQMRYFAPSSSERKLPFVFMTQSNWLDRLHHVLLKVAWRRQDTRMHTVRFHPVEAINSSSHPWTVCGEPAFPHNRRVRRAYVCDLNAKWRFKHPFPPRPPPAAPPMVSIPRHIELRVADFKRQYPNLQFDLTILTTRSILSSESFTSKLPIVFYSMENVEITTWIRGRRCRSRYMDCETVLVDDYRYEGATLISNAEDWRMVTGALRAIAQVYIWVRFILLVLGVYRARSGEPKFRRRSFFVRLVATLVTLSKIPSHVVVYGSWLPVVCYSAAHVIDSGITHLISNNVWASIDGLFHFQFVSYVRSASVQMRNVWLVALTWKIALFSLTLTHGKSRGAAWVPRNGIVAMRGVIISFIAWVTIFSFLRALRFRDTNIIAITELPRHTPFNGLRFPPTYTNIADFGYRLDVKTVAVATILVTVYGQLLQQLVSSCTKRRTRFFFCRTYYIPHSAGQLWPRAMLHLFWNLTLTRSKQLVDEATSSSQRYGSLNWRLVSSHVIAKTILPPVPNTHVQCPVCNRAQSLIHWKSVQGCVRHDQLFRIDTRPPEIWAMVRLVNMALLSDPIALARVYLFGRELFVYTKKLTAEIGETPLETAWGPQMPDPYRTAFLVPATLEDMGEATPATAAHLELVAIVNAKYLSWSVLVNCG